MKVCPDCKLEMDESNLVCPDCGYVFETKKNDFTKSKKKINTVIIFIVIIIIIVLAIIIFHSVSEQKDALKEKNAKVEKICKSGKYQDNVLITNVIDTYSCENFASYLIDNGIQLTEANYEELIKKNDKNVYEVIYQFSGNDISKYYHKEIINLKYFEFLADNKLFSLIDKKDYGSYLSRSVDNNDFELFKLCLKGNYTSNLNYEWSGDNYYFGGKFYGTTEYANIASTTVKTMKKVASEQIDFANEFYNYPYNDQIGAISLFNKQLFEKAYNGKNFGKTLMSYGYYLSYLSLDEIKKYISFGGKFYKDNDDDFDKMLKEFLNSKNQSDGGFTEKLNYILGEAKKEGYQTNYSGLLDYYVNTYSLSQMYDKDKLRKNIYKTFVNQGFKCYSSCSYIKYYK